MTVRIEVNQVKDIIAPEEYRIETTVTYVEGIDENVFVYDVFDDSYNHVAYPYDMIEYPSTKQEAEDAGLGYYRKSVAVQLYTDVLEATKAADYTLSRLDVLAKSMNVVDTSFKEERTHTSIGE